MLQSKLQTQPGFADPFLPENNFDVVIIGGGLAGLTAAILLSAENKKVLLIEKKIYPFHKVCGEYISNEVLHFLISIGFDPFIFGAMPVHKIRMSTHRGKNIHANLDLGGFALSRFVFDHELAQLAQNEGAEIITGTRVTNVDLVNERFRIITDTGSVFTAKVAIGSWGKRDVLDKKLDRSFIKEHTGYMAVKYHIKTNYPEGEIGLDNFTGGYCGIVKIEDDKYNLCYLYNKKTAGKFKSIEALEKKILFRNPQIKEIFKTSLFLYDEPEVINEVSFAPKELILDHILLCGDTAGLITPLCGNGMSMAIHGAKILSEEIIASGILAKGTIDLESRLKIESNYRSRWNAAFRKRLFWGRKLQSLLANPVLGSASLRTMHAIPLLEKWMIQNTHGKPII